MGFMQWEIRPPMQREEQPPRTIKAATISVLGVSMEEPQLEAAHNLHQTPSQEFLPENFGERSDMRRGPVMRRLRRRLPSSSKRWPGCWRLQVAPCTRSRVAAFPALLQHRRDEVLPRPRRGPPNRGKDAVKPSGQDIR